MIKEGIVKRLLEIVPKDKKVIIVNIGTDREIFDSLAPLVGSILNERQHDFKVYGCLHKPIHALNLDYRMDIIEKLHKDDFIIGVDACVASQTRKLGDIFLREKSLKPGSGAGKNLRGVGDISILGVTIDKSLTNITRLSFVNDLAIDIVDTIMEFSRIRSEEVLFNEN